MLRFLIAVFALWAPCAWAFLPPQLPRAMEEAPVERALENVSNDRDLTPAQRERLLGRLHLIAYAQANTQFIKFANGEWQPRGTRPCGDSAYQIEGERRRLCPFGHVGYGTPEFPQPTAADAHRRVEHLNLARTHYQRALTMDGSSLRAHLGLAYVLDRLNENNSARAQLHRVIALAQERIQTDGHSEYLFWEDYTVLIEAVDHLDLIAHSRADRRTVRALRQRLGHLQEGGYITPIFVPLSDESFDALTAPSSPVAFDFSGTGDLRAQGWLTPDAAWLVWDPHQSGEIRNGFDLIGQRTWAVFWTDGFEAMRSLDDNGDGELAGPELGGLALWRDANSNGLSEPGEVAPVEAFGIAALAARGAEDRPGLLVAPNGVRFEDGTRRPLYDWSPGATVSPTS